MVIVTLRFSEQGDKLLHLSSKILIEKNVSGVIKATKNCATKLER